MRRRQQSGFTLIELVVTLMVGAVLVALAVPSFRDLLDKSRLRGATDDIVNLLNVARANAIKLQRDVNVSVVATSSTVWCSGAVTASTPAVGDPVLTAAACDCTALVATCLVNGQASLVSSSSYLNAGLTIDSANQLLLSKGGITFNSKFGALDLASTQPTDLKVTSPLGRYSTQISVSPLGETHVCTPSSSPFVSGYPSC